MDNPTLEELQADIADINSGTMPVSDTGTAAPEPVVVPPVSEPVVDPVTVPPVAGTPVTPPADTPPVDPTLPPADPAPVAEVNPFDKVKDLTAGRITDPEVLRQTIAAADLASELLEDADIKALYEFKKNGGTTANFYKAQATDYKALPKEDVIKMKLAEEYPTANKEQLNALFEKRYGFIDPEDDSVEAFIAQAEMDKAYNAALSSFEEQKVKSLQVGKSPEQIELERQQQEYVANFQKEAEVYSQALTKLDFGFSVKDMQDPNKLNDFTFEYTPDVNDKAVVMEVQKDPYKITSLFLTPDGNLDRGLLSRAALYARNEKKLLTAATNKAVADEREAFVKGLQNATTAPLSSPPPKDETAEQYNERMANKGQGVPI
jgi:hypothetical protein